ncbi:alpha/beta-hydrolase [Cryphonectria parasitica EP155]|uniref:Carboxylic ester hydrolase n=1 Tax=Cryphonectria parasitica (strain ATCC 38755 / EP155) TaxID=660469 RepID=A0A9P4XUG4_CRYP1|nr:alpha/beta-hydrolase [Cryphonectria parasitica EP155]KAF3761203.1 alpha/beta-hydrolase [Cryphonectria parasitica EP155]
MARAPGLLAGLATISLALGAALQPRVSQQVTTSYGTVEGATSDLESGVTVYKGIPFATPPVGDLRWTAPTPPANWTGVLNATSFGADCAQSYSALGIFSSGSYDISEDCLYMNIWTPSNATSTSNLPVFIWIYGGRFEGGAGSVPTYDGSHLAAKDLVVVTFNYRMGPFGFLAHPELSAESGHNASGNYGLLDQIQAITFLQEEVAAFGGDPDHITVGGQSAGSASALDMMYSPLSSDKLVGCISESGARDPHDPETYGLATSHRLLATAEEQGITFVAEMNVTTIAELRNVSMDDLLEYDSAMDTILDGTVYENSTLGFVSEPPLWRPVVDGYVLPYTYGESLRRNAHGDMPILTGDNEGESTDSDMTLTEYQEGYAGIMGNLTDTFLEAYPASNDTEATAQNAGFGRDVNRVSTWRWAEDWYSGGATNDVFVYFWTHAPPNQTAGAYHGSELWYTFGNLPTYYNYTWTEQDYEIQAIMGDYWANFIKTGNPNGGSLTNFPASNPNVSQIMWLGDSFGASYIADNSSKIAVIEEFFSQNIEF